MEIKKILTPIRVNIHRTDTLTPEGVAKSKIITKGYIFGVCVFYKSYNIISYKEQI